MLIFRRAIDRTALAFDDRDETVATRIIGGYRQLSLPQFASEQQIGINAVAAAISSAQFDPVTDIVAEQFDGSGNCALPVRYAAAAAGDSGAAKSKCILAGPGHPAAERIGLRHTVQYQ